VHGHDEICVVAGDHHSDEHASNTTNVARVTSSVDTIHRAPTGDASSIDLADAVELQTLFRVPAESHAARRSGPHTIRPRAGYIRRAVREIVLYGRPGCHLCDDARVVLERVRTELPFTLVERDIERDDALFKAYLERIPVVALDGEELFDFFVDEGELRRRLAYTGER